MPSRTVVTEHDRALLLTWMAGMKLPFVAKITKGRPRSIEQNKLNWMWMGEISEQLGDMTIEEVRGTCKLTHGVPILRAENEQFREVYDRLIKDHPYEAKVEMMMLPLDFAITRIMKVPQMQAYLDAIHRHYTAEGVQLTEPEG